jgi:hypothetical protein
MSGALVLVILGFMVVVSVVIIVVTRQDEAKRARRRHRFELTDTGQRLPLAGEKPPEPPPRPIQEIAAFVAADSEREPFPSAPDLARTRAESALLDDAPPEGVRGRFVTTPEGESLLTSPPFKRRDAIFSRRHGKYALSLVRRIPPWLTVCPKVRLDTLVAPTSPDGRDPEDWREWRRRVRMRSVDLLLVDQRTWAPLLAIMLDREHPAAATTVGAGRDNIVDEVLGVIGIPLIRATGSLKNDWPAIRPYVEQAMLPAGEDADREPSALSADAGHAWDASAVVKLLRIDDERGGLLE